MTHPPGRSVRPMAAARARWSGPARLMAGAAHRPSCANRQMAGRDEMSATTKPAPIRLEDHRAPSMPTATKVRYGDGRVLPVGGGLWLYRKVPMAPARDAKSHARALEVGDPIAAAF